MRKTGRKGKASKWPQCATDVGSCCCQMPWEVRGLMGLLKTSHSFQPVSNLSFIPWGELLLCLGLLEAWLPSLGLFNSSPSLEATSSCVGISASLGLGITRLGHWPQKFWP